MILNGRDEPVDDGTTVDALVGAHAPAGAPVAVALNGEVLPRSAWSSTVLQPGDAVELLSATPGG